MLPAVRTLAAMLTTGALKLDVNALLDRRAERRELFRAWKLPRTFPRLLVDTFRCLRTETVGAKQYVLEQNRVLSHYWRIREKGNPFVTQYYVWDTFENEAQAVELWESFVAEMRARAEREE